MSAELAGRGGELEILDAALGDAASGRGRSILVLGEPGIGKTRLVECLAEHARESGFRVAWGRCMQGESPPFWPWRQALRSLLGPRADALSTDATVRAGLFASIVDDLESAMSDAPGVVVLEDVHWADAPSLALLAFTVGAVPGIPLALVATARDDPLELAPEAAEALRDLPPSVTRLPLDGLDVQATGAIVRDTLGRATAPAFVEDLHARTGGNPFFIQEVARLHVLRGDQGRLTVPPGVKQVLGRRFARLSQPAHEVLATAAILGDELELDLLASMTNRGPEELLGVLAEAVRAGLVAERDEGFAFAHALVRETLYEDHSPDMRAALHRAAAELLEARTADDAETASGRIAAHWMRAHGEDAQHHAGEAALRAARAAMSGMGYEQAVRYYEWATQTGAGGDITVLVELGEAQVLAGDMTRGRWALRQAAEAAARAGRAGDLARAVLAWGTGVGGFEVELGDEQQVRLLEESLAGLPPGDGALRAAVLARLSLALSGFNTVERRAAQAKEAAEMARQVGDPRAEVSALSAYCDAVAGPDHVGERLAAADRMISLATSVDDPVLLLLARRFRLVALCELGDFRLVDAEIEAYARTSDRLRLPLYSWPVPLWRGMRALMAGNIAEAWRSAKEVEELGRKADSANADTMTFTLRAAAATADGTLGDLGDEYERVMAQFVAYPPAEAMWAAFFAATGETARARAALSRLLPAFDSLPIDSEWLEMLWNLGDVAVVVEERDAAQIIYDALESYPHLWAFDGISAACFGVISHQLGRLAAFLGHHEQAITWLDDALGRYRAAGANLFIDQVECDKAELGAAHRERAGAAASPLSREEGEFRHEGRLWHVRWRGESARVPDSKGMRDLATLLGCPGREVHVLDLVEAGGGPQATAAGGDAGEMLDSRARDAYRRRLQELETEIESAEADADLGRASSLREEQDFIARELAAALGLGGRARRAGDRVERARKAVAMRLSTALRAIEQVHPALARHLRICVSTGRFCVYRTEDPVVWHT